MYPNAVRFSPLSARDSIEMLVLKNILRRKVLINMITFAYHYNSDMKTIELIKSRSIKASIKDAWYIFALNWKKYLKLTLLPVVPAALSGAFVIELCVQYICRHLLPAYRLHQAEAASDWVHLILVPSMTDLLLFLFSLLFFVFFLSYHRAKQLGIIDRYAVDSQFADRGTVSFVGRERVFAFKCLAVSLGASVLFLLFSALIVAAAVRWQIRLLYLLPLWALYVWTTHNVTMLQYTLRGDKLWPSLRRGLKQGMGYPLIVQGLTAVPMSLLLVVFCSPALVYLLSAMAAEDARLVGDTPVVPGFVPFLFFVLHTVGLAMVGLCNSVRRWSLVMRLNLYEARSVQPAEAEETESAK